MFDDILGPSKKKCGCKQCDGEDKRCNEEDKYCNGGDCEHKEPTAPDLSNVEEKADNYEPEEDEDLWDLDSFIEEEDKDPDDNCGVGCIKGRNKPINIFEFLKLANEISDYITQKG